MALGTFPSLVALLFIIRGKTLVYEYPGLAVVSTRLKRSLDGDPVSDKIMLCAHSSPCMELFVVYEAEAKSRRCGGELIHHSKTHITHTYTRLSKLTRGPMVIESVVYIVDIGG